VVENDATFGPSFGTLRRSRRRVPKWFLLSTKDRATGEGDSGRSRNRVSRARANASQLRPPLVDNKCSIPAARFPEREMPWCSHFRTHSDRVRDRSAFANVQLQCQWENSKIR